jgi:hypothetical protein
MSARPPTPAMLRELRHIARHGSPGDLADYGSTHLAFWSREKVLTGLIARGLLLDAETVTAAGNAMLGHIEAVEAVKAETASGPTATLYSFEYVPNNLGVWDRRWFESAADAESERAGLIDREGYDPDREGGDWGCIGDVETITVPLTAAGLLDFANTYAIDGGE